MRPACSAGRNQGVGRADRSRSGAVAAAFCHAGEQSTLGSAPGFVEVTRGWWVWAVGSGEWAVGSIDLFTAHCPLPTISSLEFRDFLEIFDEHFDTASGLAPIIILVFRVIAMFGDAQAYKGDRGFEMFLHCHDGAD